MPTTFFLRGRQKERKIGGETFASWGERLLGVLIRNLSPFFFSPLPTLPTLSHTRIALLHTVYWRRWADGRGR